MTYGRIIPNAVKSLFLDFSVGCVVRVHALKINYRYFYIIQINTYISNILVPQRYENN